jgi:ribosome-binding protein aMBF1 (putative translation factor)
MTKEATYHETFRRGMLRSAFHSLFWGVIVSRKRNSGLKMQDIADKLGVNKSFVSRSFSNPPNWRIETLADFADVLDLDLIVEARDRKTGRIFTPAGIRSAAVTTTCATADAWSIKVDLTASKRAGTSTVSTSL